MYTYTVQKQLGIEIKKQHYLQKEENTKPLDINKPHMYNILYSENYKTFLKQF